MAGVDLSFACTCGAVQGTLHDITPSAGGQVQCHCDDCRRAIVWLGQADPGPDGVQYYQTTPNRVTFEKGGDTLAAYTWKSPKLVRWFAPCCKAPLFNTLNSPKWAFASFMVDRLEDPSPLGPVKAHAFVPKPNGKRGHTNALGFMGGFIKRTISARVSGTWRDTPFFDDGGAAIVSIQKLSHEDRAKAQL
jgi:hypothetical protein